MPRFLASVLSSVPVYAFDSDVTAVDVALAKFSEAEASTYVLSKSPVTGLFTSLDSKVGFFHPSCNTILAR